MLAPPSTSQHSRVLDALTARAQGLPAAYLQLCNELQAASAAEAMSLLNSLTCCASCFRADAHTDLVERVLRLPWREDEALASAVCEFVQDLVTASTSFLRAVVDELVQSFLPTEHPKSAAPTPEQAAATMEAALRSSLHVHRALQGILHACPLAIGHLHHSLREHFPHRRRSLQAHSQFLTHTLNVLAYSPALRQQLVELLTERLVDLDVQITLQQRALEALEEEDEAAIFQVDLVETSAAEINNMRANAEKLDAMMVMLFNFIKATCSASEMAAGRGVAVAATDTAPSRALFDALTQAFRSAVLQTFKCRSTQFLLFYCCSFEVDFCHSFLRLCLSQVQAEQLHTEARTCAAAYVTSFLARATFVPFETTLQTLSALVSWARSYQQHAVAKLQGRAPTLDVSLHGVFYSVVQGVLYVLCYKHELLNAAEHAAARGQIGAALTPLLLGELNPLKFCLDNVVVEFERLELCDVAAQVAANERTVIGSRSTAGGANKLEDFFPFDPIQLKRCSQLLEPIFHTWTPLGGSEPRESNLTGSLCSDADDALSESLSKSLQGMSVTPMSADELDTHMRKRVAENRRLFNTIVSARAGA